ncbi:Aminotransferase-like, plant mobile domain [Sesbania bispinosa]|nr:Aminotransferase-like, plant mobile domain [Sesbania bispinosa]
MVKTRLARVDPVFEDSSSSTDSAIDLIPRSISSITWTRLPPPRGDPLDATSRKWMTGRQPAIRPFCLPPSSGSDFFKDSLVAPSVCREEALLFHEVANTPTHTVGSSLLRSRLIRGEFPWVPCTFVARATIKGCWAEWVEYTFANDPLFVDILKCVGIADAMKLSPRLSVFKRVEDLNALIQRWSHSTHTFFAAWSEFTPTLEDVHVLLKLPLFGDFEITTASIDNHVIDRAKELKAATIESAKYSREFLARLQAEPFDPASNMKTPARRVRGSGNVIPPGKRKMARESL